MKQIYCYFSLNQAYLLVRFFLSPLVWLALITFSGTVFFVSAQTTSLTCEKIETELNDLKLTKQVTEKMQRYKINEVNMRQNMSVLDKAIANGRLIKQEQLEVLAENLGDILPKDVGQMTPEERATYQRETRDRLVQIIDRLKLVSLEDLDAKLDRINKDYDELSKAYDNGCKGEVIEMTSCEISDGKKVCRSWTAYPSLHKIEADTIRNVTDTLAINKWEDDEVLFTLDSDNEENHGYSAVYTGKRSGNRVDGTVKWSDGKGGGWTSQWSVTW